MNKELIDKYINDINELGFNKNLTLNSKDVSKILSVKPRTLDNWRKENLGPNCKNWKSIHLHKKRCS